MHVMKLRMTLQWNGQSRSELAFESIPWRLKSALPIPQRIMISASESITGESTGHPDTTVPNGETGGLESLRISRCLTVAT